MGAALSWKARGRQRELGEKLVADIKRYSKLACSVGISRSTQGIDQLSTVYPLAAKALFQRFYSGQAGVFIEEDTGYRRQGRKVSEGA